MTSTSPAEAPDEGAGSGVAPVGGADGAPAVAGADGAPVADAGGALVGGADGAPVADAGGAPTAGLAPAAGPVAGSGPAVDTAFVLASGPLPGSPDEVVAEAERWFVRNGVPHFVEESYYMTRLPAFLRPFAATIRLARLGVMLGFWTVRRVFAEVREVGHLAVRALPLLALFGMVIFFTRDFWLVSASMTSGWLWVTSAFFIMLIQTFLIARLPEEFVTLPSACTPDRIRASCVATPLASLADAEDDLSTDPALGLGQRRNMFMYLLLTQTIQISLLSWMVFFFYVVFGAIAIRPEVLKDWFGHVPPDARLWGIRVPGVSSELLHVAVLLAGLSALYFAITALTDAVYRREFFDRTLAEFDKAIHMRCAYLTARSRCSPR